MRSERDPSLSALDWPARAGTGDLVLQELSARAQVRRRRRTTAAATVAVLLVGVGAFISSQLGTSHPSNAPAPAIANAAPSTQQILPDGSVVELKNGARLTTDFSGTLRCVDLTQGTAHFQVVKNPDRPFIVRAGGVAVRAVGTAFSVELETSGVEVLVTEGRVAVERSSLTSISAIAPTEKLATVDAGAGVSLDLAPVAQGGAPVVRAVPTTIIEEKLSWRSRQLELTGTPLVEVVALLNRHAGGQPRTRFTIADSEIESVKLSGVIRTDKTDALIHLLEAECGVRAERRADGQIVLHKAR